MGSLAGNYTALENFALQQEGEYKVITSANPAAGQEIVYTVPAKTGFFLLGFTAFLTTSAVVANRQPGLQIEDDNFDTLGRFIPGAAQAASLVSILWNWSADLPIAQAAIVGASNTGAAAMGIPRLFLPAGYIVRTKTIAIDAGDDWTAASVFGIEYRMP